MSNFSNSNNPLRYKLASNKVKKIDCPFCGAKKHWQRYIDIKTGEVLPEIHGRCDNNDKCGEWITPKETGYAKMIWEQEHKVTKVTKVTVQKNNYFKPKTTVQSQNKRVFFDFETFKETLRPDLYQSNMFVQNLLHNISFPFKIRDVELLIQLYRIGTAPNGATCFPFIDVAGNICAIQEKHFDHNNNTDKTKKHHTSWTHARLQNTIYRNKPLPLWLQAYVRQDKRVNSLFGEHLLNKYECNPVALVEAPKTAVYGALYFGFPDNPYNMIWLAVGAKGWLNFEKAEVLKGRFVYVFPDLSKDSQTYVEWKKKAKDYEVRLPGTLFIFSDLLERLATEKDKCNGNDIADYLIRQNWRSFRKQNLQNEQLHQEPEVNAEVTKVINENNFTFSNVEIFQKSEVLDDKFSETTVEESQNWNDDIIELEIFFLNAKLPPYPIKLNKFSLIKDCSFFIESHMKVIKANNGNRVFLPYLNRLFELKKALE